MADVTQELMLRVRGDNSGADKAIESTKTAVEGLKVSGEKATGAFKNFSRSLAESRDASDVAASAANSLSTIVSKSLTGAFAVGAVKLFTDQINRMGEDVKSVATSAQKAFDDIEKAGQAMSLSEAINQVSQLDALLASTGKKLSELDRSPFQNFIAGATGARTAMEQLVGTSQKLRDMKLAEGLATENANAEFVAGLNEQETQIAKVNAEYEKRFKIAQTLADEEAYRIYQEASHAIRIRETNAIIDSMAQKAAQEKQKNLHEEIKLNKDLSQQQIKGEKELAEAQQERFNKLYDSEVKAQEATQNRIDANLKAEQDLADKLTTLRDAVEEAKKKVPSGGGAMVTGGGGGGITEGRPVVPGLTTDTGQKPSSAEVGAQAAAQRAFTQGLKESAEALRQYYENQLKANGLAHDADAVTRKLIDNTEELAKEQGKAQFGIKDFLDGVKKAAEELYEFKKSTQEAAKSLNKFETDMSKVEPAFDKAINSAQHLADGITKNTGDMVDAFLKTEGKATNLSTSFSDLGKTADDLVNKLDKVGDREKGKQKDNSEGSLSSIEKLLQKNFDELKAYAHAT
jgi:ABC-type transporter Mla subunit MlaD